MHTSDEAGMYAHIHADTLTHPPIGPDEYTHTKKYHA